MAALAREVEALDGLCGGDERLFHDMILGETDLDRIVLRIHEQLARDAEMLVGIKERKAAIAEREARIQARHDNAKAFIGKALRIARLPKLELPEVTYSVRDGKTKLALADKDAVPTEYQRATYAPDMAAIKDAFGEADTLPNWLSREPATDIVTARTK